MRADAASGRVTAAPAAIAATDARVIVAQPSGNGAWDAWVKGRPPSERCFEPPTACTSQRSPTVLPRSRRGGRRRPLGGGADTIEVAISTLTVREE